MLTELDDAVLGLFIESMGDDFGDVVDAYSAMMPDSFALVQAAIDAEDAKALQIEIHSVKSNCRQVGALHLADVAAAVEAQAKEGEIVLDAQAQLDAMLLAWAEIETVLRIRAA